MHCYLHSHTLLQMNVTLKHIFKQRISIARNNVRQQQNKEMVPAVYNDTFDAFHNKGCNIEYMEIGEPSYINTNARGLV